MLVSAASGSASGAEAQRKRLIEVVAPGGKKTGTGGRKSWCVLFGFFERGKDGRYAKVVKGKQEQ